MIARRIAVALGVALLLAAATAGAQSGGAYDLRHNTIDGGGATGSFSSAYKLGGTIGQADAGRLSSGAYSLSGGFWAGIQVSTPYPDAHPHRDGDRPVHVEPFAVAHADRDLGTDDDAEQHRESCAQPIPDALAHAERPDRATRRIPRRATSQTGSPTPTIAPSDTPSPTPSPSPTESPRVTPAAVCVGDCSLDDAVTIAELLRMVNIALGDAAVDTCEAGDPNHDQAVTINEILQAVSNALAGCG